MTHYAEVPAGEIKGVFRNADAPDPESRTPGADDLVVNMSMQLGSATVMASDNSDEMYDKPQGFKVLIAPTSLEEFDRIYEALAKDAQSVAMAPGETFWADRFAMFTDIYGTPWMLNHRGSKMQGEPK
jgi:PhnB protein